MTEQVPHPASQYEVFASKNIKIKTLIDWHKDCNK